jgi:hypothetical protein
MFPNAFKKREGAKPWLGPDSYLTCESNSSAYCEDCYTYVYGGGLRADSNLSLAISFLFLYERIGKLPSVDLGNTENLPIGVL